MQFNNPRNGYKWSADMVKAECIEAVKLIRLGLKKYLAEQEKRITKIEENPDNEGQVTYAVMIEECRANIAFANEFIESLT